jgi:predicted nucleic-acid-binding protein
MIAIDTNVLVRLLVGDDPDMERRARACVTREQGWISLTVLLEAAWVLRSTYGCSRDTLANVVDGLLQSKDLALENRRVTEMTVTALRAGLEFADALHVAQAHHLPHFATFDARLSNGAARVFDRPTVQLI